MRGYPGIMSYSMTIDEEALAKSCDATVPWLHQLLYQLSLDRIINYIPAEQCSIVYLHHDRLTPGNIDLKPERYHFLRSNAETRLGAVERYLQDGETCRSRQLLAYFGQEKTEDCGTCDVCRARGAEDRTRAALKRFLKEHPGATPVEVKEFCGNPKNGMPQNAMEVYRRLLDEGLI